MKTPSVVIVAALFAIGSLSTIARAGSYDNDDYGNDDNYSDDDSQSYHQQHHHQYYCHWKRVKWYDDYGERHYKRVKICG